MLPAYNNNTKNDEQPTVTAQEADPNARCLAFRCWPESKLQGATPLWFSELGKLLPTFHGSLDSHPAYACLMQEMNLQGAVPRIATVTSIKKNVIDCKKKVRTGRELLVYLPHFMREKTGLGRWKRRTEVTGLVNPRAGPRILVLFPDVMPGFIVPRQMIEKQTNRKANQQAVPSTPQQSKERISQVGFNWRTWRLAPQLGRTQTGSMQELACPLILLFTPDTGTFCMSLHAREVNS